jgi:hypothetical protein
MILFGTIHIITSLSCLLLLFAPHLEPALLNVLLLVYLFPQCDTVWYWSMKGIMKFRKRLPGV